MPFIQLVEVIMIVYGLSGIKKVVRLNGLLTKKKNVKIKY